MTKPNSIFLKIDMILIRCDDDNIFILEILI